MKAGQSRPADEMRMSGKEFDRIMRQALRIKPEDAQKPKRATKTMGITRSSRVTAGRWFGKVRKSGNSLDHWNRAH
jgi:hypothetical protein